MVSRREKSDGLHSQTGGQDVAHSDNGITLMIRFAIILQIALLLYHQVTTLFDFFPFNGVRFYSRRETFMEAGVNLVLMSLPLIGFIWHVSFLMKCGVVYYFILFSIECATWWAPYFLGPSPKGLECYNRIHRQTITVIPRRGNNPAPNLEHMILMVLTLLTAITTLMAFRPTPFPFRQWWIGVVIGAFMVGGTVFQFCFQGKQKSNAPPA